MYIAILLLSSVMQNIAPPQLQQPTCSFRCASSFFAVQGINDTTRMRLASTPIRFAKTVFATEPNICCGDRVVDKCGMRFG
eukprot:m.133497 g.133497  ORF g.133497 m.133497 type:complete len:81 (-) comp13944_c5_seq1:1347-1589(-)